MSPPFVDHLPSVARPHKGVLRKMLSYLRPHWASATALLVATTVGTIAELLPALNIRRIVDDVLIVGGNWRALAWFIVALLTARMVMWVAEVGRGWLGASLGTRVVATLRSHLYRRLHEMRFQHFDERSVGA